MQTDVPGGVPGIGYTVDGVATVAIVEVEPQRAIVMVHVAQPKAHIVHGLIMHAVTNHPYKYMDAWVEAGNEKAARLNRMCGFQWRKSLPKFHEGRDFELYVREA